MAQDYMFGCECPKRRIVKDVLPELSNWVSASAVRVLTTGERWQRKGTVFEDHARCTPMLL